MDLIVDFSAEFSTDFCRLCVCATDGMIGIYDKEGNEKNIAAKINKHLEINVSIFTD